MDVWPTKCALKPWASTFLKGPCNKDEHAAGSALLGPLICVHYPLFVPLPQVTGLRIAFIITLIRIAAR